MRRLLWDEHQRPERICGSHAGGQQRIPDGGAIPREPASRADAAAFPDADAVSELLLREPGSNRTGAIQGVRYDMATQACDTRNTIQNSTRDIIDNQNSNSRAILDFLTQSKMRDLENENQGLRLAASQSAQSEALKAYMSGQFAYYNPRPVPSFSVPAPYQFAGCNGSQYVCGACA